MQLNQTPTARQRKNQQGNTMNRHQQNDQMGRDWANSPYSLAELQNLLNRIDVPATDQTQIISSYRRAKTRTRKKT